jgi:endonuclease/exonuclease/phosphatase (EEP) superfamily protein YafD
MTSVRNPSSTPPPVTEEMLKAGIAIASMRASVERRNEASRRDRVSRIYFAMNAARSNQEATRPLPADFNPLVDKLDDAQLDEVERAMTGRKESTRTVGDAELRTLATGETHFERAKRVIAEQGTGLTIEQVEAQRDLWIISASEWAARLEQVEAAASIRGKV